MRKNFSIMIKDKVYTLSTQKVTLERHFHLMMLLTIVKSMAESSHLENIFPGAIEKAMRALHRETQVYEGEAVIEFYDDDEDD